MRLIPTILYSESDELVRELIRDLFGEHIIPRFTHALVRALPELGATEVALRFHFLVGSMAHVISGRHLLSPVLEALPQPPARERVLAEMIAFLAAGFRAPRVESPARESEDAA
jgi:hypothetical protein